MSADFWLGFIAGFVAAVGLLFVFVFLPEGNEPRTSRKPDQNDRSLLTS
jgi:hypothetical protein